MTFGEMHELTNRLNSIKKSVEPLRKMRFENMMNDIVLAYGDNEGIIYDKHAIRIHSAVVQEMEVKPNETSRSKDPLLS